VATELRLAESGDLPAIARFLAALHSNAPSPGAGAAGAVALALGAACAGKAASISLRHSPDDTVLADADAALRAAAARALWLAEEDCRCFTQHLAQKDDGSAAALERCGQQLLELAQQVDSLCTQLQGRISTNMHGDIVAAGALVAASRSIQHRNLDEGQPATPAEGGEGGFERAMQSSEWTSAALARELDVDVTLVQAWRDGRETPPRVVALALAELVSRHRPRAEAASSVIGGAP
jgi:DNA-binding transcriptional regulator YiaG